MEMDQVPHPNMAKFMAWTTFKKLRAVINFKVGASLQVQKGNKFT